MKKRDCRKRVLHAVVGRHMYIFTGLGKHADKDGETGSDHDTERCVTERAGRTVDIELFAFLL